MKTLNLIEYFGILGYDMRFIYWWIGGHTAGHNAEEILPEHVVS